MIHFIFTIAAVLTITVLGGCGKESGNRQMRAGSDDFAELDRLVTKAANAKSAAASTEMTGTDQERAKYFLSLVRAEASDGESNAFGERISGECTKVRSALKNESSLNFIIVILLKEIGKICDKLDPEPSQQSTAKPPITPTPVPTPVPTATPTPSTITHLGPRTPSSQDIFKDLVFYDGYAAPVATPEPAGVTRLANYLYTRRLGDKELTAIGNDLTVEVTLNAACDNYDRGGHVRLVLAPKGVQTYDHTSTPRIEMGRFITPFMNKNKQPSSVSYSFKVDHIARILNDATLLATYDFWVEFSVWGTSGAAVKEVSGCAGHNDVYIGNLRFISTQAVPANAPKQFILSLGEELTFNNYKANATDAIGQTVLTLKVDLAADVEDAQVAIITSSHGASAGGEEYNRRLHQVSLDGKQILSYTPGGESCEPYRKYNTMGNGIYGFFPKSWGSSNWCPGASVPTRYISIGKMLSGSHAIKVAVPDAVFRGKDGNIPLSVYIFGSVGESL